MKNRICDLYRTLFRRYGEQHWWPSKTGARWEIAAGAVLTQNCAWRNVELALANLESAGFDTPDRVLAADRDTLCEAIRPAGFFNQKSRYLAAMAEFFLAHEAEFLTPCGEGELRERRKILLSVKGAGRETADSILLYAFGQPLFVIDAYTRRVSVRHLGIDGAEKMPYDDLQNLFMRSLPREVMIYNEFHALLVRLCKENCLKSSCRCTFLR